MDERDDKTNGASDSDNSYRYSLRMEEDQEKRIRKIAKMETNRAGYPITLAAILRKCIALGLEKLEQRIAK